MQRDLFDISAEVQAVSYELAAIGSFFEDGAEQGIDYPTRATFKEMFFAIQHHLQRIADDLTEVSK